MYEEKLNKSKEFSHNRSFKKKFLENERETFNNFDNMYINEMLFSEKESSFKK